MVRTRRAGLALVTLTALVTPAAPTYSNDDTLLTGARYVLDPGSWPGRTVTYRLTNNTPDLPYLTTLGEMQAAFRTWEQVLPLRFVPVTGQAQIEITFTSGAHGDAEPFDGPGNITAHAAFPPPTNPNPAAGDIHFDEAETWTDLPQNAAHQPVHLRTIALHEMGHAIGLDHSSVRGAVMERGYDGSRTVLTPDDIAGARAKYAHPHRWSAEMCRHGERCALADVTGDNRDDAIAVIGTDLWVAPSTGAAFDTARSFGRGVCPPGAHCDFADVDGNGTADVVAYLKGANPKAQVALSNGTSLGAPQTWSPHMCPLDEVCATADVDGDHRADAVAFTKNAPVNPDDIWVARSTGAGFATPVQWSNHMCTGTEKCHLADVNGDNRADALISKPTGQVWVALSIGTAFGPPTRWAEPGICWNLCTFGDLNEDRMADVISFSQGPFDDVVVSLSTGSRFGTWSELIPWTDDMCRDPEFCAVGDVDGDGAVDTAAFIQNAQQEPYRNDVWVTLS